MPNWKKVIVSGSNAVLNNITASGHLNVLNDGFTVNTATETELEVQGSISGSGELEVKYRKLNLTSTTPNDYNGDVVFFGTAGSGFGTGVIVRYTGTSWVTANVSVVNSGYQLLGIALGSDPSDGVLIRGFYTLNYDAGNNGDVLYLSQNASGTALNTPPTNNGNVSRIIGNILNGQSSNNTIYFNPSPDWIEISA